MCFIQQKTQVAVTDTTEMARLDWRAQYVRRGDRVENIGRAQYVHRNDRVDQGQIEGVATTGGSVTLAFSALSVATSCGATLFEVKFWVVIRVVVIDAGTWSDDGNGSISSAVSFPA